MDFHKIQKRQSDVG